MQRYLWASILLLLSFVVWLFFYPKRQNLMDVERESVSVPALSEGEIPQVYWQTLQKLDYKLQSVEDELLKSVLDREVRIPGFAVPLADNLMAVQEFLLVPNQMACIHVPPPPPNLIVFVKLSKPVKIEELMGPLWVQGVLRLKTLHSVYGASSYQMQDVKVEPYEF